MMPPAPLLSVRVTPTERDMLAAAAEHAHTSLSDFVEQAKAENSGLPQAMIEDAIDEALEWARRT
jgi:uncharacterized protein (DUF1778 family)